VVRAQTRNATWEEAEILNFKFSIFKTQQAGNVRLRGKSEYFL
jgi:hypothetical protein